jgi:hypothetical protein
LKNIQINKISLMFTRWLNVHLIALSGEKQASTSPHLICPQLENDCQFQLWYNFAEIKTFQIHADGVVAIRSGRGRCRTCLQSHLDQSPQTPKNSNPKFRNTETALEKPRGHPKLCLWVNISFLCEYKPPVKFQNSH